MAVPTFISITPATADPGGGSMVDIVGTGFRTRAQSFTIPVGHVDQPTVAVTFDGIAAEAVYVFSDVLLRVRVPDMRSDPSATAATRKAMADPTLSRVSFPAVDVVITNIDDAGSPIGGETVTAAAVFTYVQPLIRAPEPDPPFLQVLKKFLQLIKKQIVSNTAINTDTDYADEGATFTELADHPAIGLRLSIARDVEYSHFDNEKYTVAHPTVPGAFQEWDASRTFMMLLPLTISSKSLGECMHMITELIDMVMATPWLIVPADLRFPLSVIGDHNHYPLELVSEPAQVGGANEANVKAFRATLRVRGIPVVRNDPLVSIIHQYGDIDLVLTDMAGANPRTVPLQ
jgi:hypothetical protein